MIFSQFNFTVFDVETTGLNPKQGDRIVEIAGVRVENGIIKKEKAFTSLVNPQREIPWQAGLVNRLSDEKVQQAPVIEEILPEFLDFAEGSILVAHKASFDLSFLEAEKEGCWGFIDIPECLCTLQLSRVLFPNERRHNLDVLCDRLDIDFDGNRHRALPDVLATAQAFLKMCEGIRSIEDLREKASAKVTA